MIAPPHLIIFTRETKPGIHKPIRFLVPFAISFITDQCNDDKLNKAIFLHHTILCLYCYFIFVSQWEDCFGQVWYVIVFPSKWHFIVCISVLNVYGNKIELLQNWVVPTTSEWKPGVLPTKVQLILEIWWYISTNILGVFLKANIVGHMWFLAIAKLITTF